MNCIFLINHPKYIVTMLTKTEKQFTLIFAIILILELICNQVESLSTLHYFVKPLLLLSLIVFFFKQSFHLKKTIRQLMLFALLFSLFGDVLLMFTAQDPLFFILGLLAFLLAHLLYTLVFLKQRDTTKKAFLFIMILLVYASGLYFVIQDGLGDMRLPVIAYMLVILMMATTAFLRKEYKENQTYKLVFLGAILFLISDSLLSLNLFYKPFAMVSFGIMLTYGIAQFLIVLGILKLGKSQ